MEKLWDLKVNENLSTMVKSRPESSRFLIWSQIMADTPKYVRIFVSLLALGLTPLGCAAKQYTWGWYVVLPTTEQGYQNPRFLYWRIGDDHLTRGFGNLYFSYIWVSPGPFRPFKTTAPERST